VSDRFEALLSLVQRTLVEPLSRLGAATGRAIRSLGTGASRRRTGLVITAICAALAYALYIRPPFTTVHRGELLVRTNSFDGTAIAYSAGTVLVSWHPPGAPLPDP